MISAATTAATTAATNPRARFLLLTALILLLPGIGVLLFFGRLGEPAFLPFGGLLLAGWLWLGLWLLHRLAISRKEASELAAALAEASKQLAAVNTKAQESIAYASLIQRSLLPTAGSFAQSFGELATLWRPRDTVGGDFFLAEQAGEHYCLALLDCTGHGVPGALMTMVGDSIVRRAISEHGLSNPGRLASTIDKLLREALNRPDVPGGFDHGMDMGLMILNPAKRTVLFIGGGIDLYLARGGALVRHKGGRKGVGYARRRPVANTSGFAVRALRLEAGDRLFMSSDGLYDQAGGEKGYGFGRSRFEAHLLETAAQPLAEQLRALETALVAYQNGQEQRDDISVVGFMVA
jgi:phosphoserine phosphatase RsbU/P